MSMTTIKVSPDLRDRLATVASSDYHGATLAETLAALIREHEQQQVLEQYERLRADTDEWDSYREESEELEYAAVADLRDRERGEA